MLNSRKLIYLLPEVCFVAELLPNKKPHNFSIHSFRQINGQFMEDEDVITENLIKLFNKLEPDTYSLILPDFLFTNTIIDVAETSEEGVRAYLLDKLLPSLGLSKATHQLETFILTQHQKKTKVQLSGLEKSILSPIFPIATERQIVIEAICPLSWTLKSIVSLEPSLTAVELGKHIYMAQHYIGVDQSVFFSTDNIADMVDSVRTLQGAEPNLQTLYLLTSLEIETRLKSIIKQKIPVQQLAEEESGVEGLPAHVKTAIEAAAKTLDIEDYLVPKFILEADLPTKEDKAEKIAPAETVLEAPLPIPKPFVLEESLAEDTVPVAAPALPITSTPLSAPVAPVAPLATLTSEVVTTTMSMRVEEEPTELDELVPSPFDAPLASTNTQFVSRPEELTSSPASQTDQENDWLNDAAQTEENEEPTSVAPSVPTMANEPRPRPVIKNRNSTHSLFKMIGITVAALLVTVAIGVGIGFGLLKAAERNAPVNQVLTPSPKASSIAQASVAPIASTSPAPAASPLISTKTKTKVLIVNATGVSGMAGKMKATLQQAGYKTLDTGNAKGKYDKGNFILLEKEDSALVAQFQKDSGTSVSFGTEKKNIEDPKSAYDVVFVINAQ